MENASSFFNLLPVFVLNNSIQNNNLSLRKFQNPDWLRRHVTESQTAQKAEIVCKKFKLSAESWNCIFTVNN